jgi:hypothetical protein
MNHLFKTLLFPALPTLALLTLGCSKDSSSTAGAPSEPAGPAATAAGSDSAKAGSAAGTEPATTPAAGSVVVTERGVAPVPAGKLTAAILSRAFPKAKIVKDDDGDEGFRTLTVHDASGAPLLRVFLDHDSRAAGIEVFTRDAVTPHKIGVGQRYADLVRALRPAHPDCVILNPGISADDVVCFAPGSRVGYGFTVAADRWVGHEPIDPNEIANGLASKTIDAVYWDATVRFPAAGATASAPEASAGTTKVAADNLIRPGVGIGRLELGMSGAAVRKAIGKPRREGACLDADGFTCMEYGARLSDRYLEVKLRDDQVEQVTFSSPQFLTAEGYGINTLHRAATAAGFACEFLEWRHPQFRYPRMQGGLTFYSFTADGAKGPESNNLGILHRGPLPKPGPHADLDWDRTDCGS